MLSPMLSFAARRVLAGPRVGAQNRFFNTRPAAFTAAQPRPHRDHSRKAQRRLLWRVDQQKKSTPKEVKQQKQPARREDPGEGIATPEELRVKELSPAVRRARVRPIALLPRSHMLYIASGPAMSVEDLERPAKSIFFESEYLKKKVLEKRITQKGDGALKTPDTPFWRIKRRKKRQIEWGESDAVDKPTKELRRDQREKKARWESKVAPEKCIAQTDNDLRQQADAGKKLIQTLRARALEFEKTGINPDYLDSMEKALDYYPGMEKAERRRAMMENRETFTSLMEKGMASVENFNLLIRAAGLQQNIEQALTIHDQMLSHGYETNTDTFVGLIMAADANAPLARQLYLKMRENLISPDTKVYSTLIKSHVSANDVTSGFALLRKMEDEGVPANVVTYTILINGLVESGKLRKAWEQFHSMRTWKNIKPDEVLFTVMIKACAQAEEAEKAINMYDDMRTEKLYPTDVTYTELIHAMSTRQDFALKAFDFKRHMEAEGMPISPIAYDHLLRACATLGDIPRARRVVSGMQKAHIPITPQMYHHLIRMFSAAMRLPKATDFERVAHLQYAWHVLNDAKKRGVPITTALMNEVLKVYIAGGYAKYAVEMLKQYTVFQCAPDVATYGSLLEMFHELKDFGRYFAIWDLMKHNHTPVEAMYHTALSMAMMSKSANKTCVVLDEMYDAAIFPSPDLASRLAKVARHVLEIHRIVGKFIELHKEKTTGEAKRTQALLQAHVDERNLILAQEGKTTHTPTPEQEVRKKYFDSLKRKGAFRQVKLPWAEYNQLKRRGGDLYSYKRDKPKPMAPLAPAHGT
eukprot:GEMP01007373.1.p1 GENE.GEMP01007373.1~~GEMP01007373.1.p1  ORF type:complete len:811 (-),score=251.37 GEMP01007373.1:1107-3539(-)